MITVQQAIEELQKIENKSLPLYLETELVSKFYVASSIVERKNFVEICTNFEEK